MILRRQRRRRSTPSRGSSPTFIAQAIADLGYTGYVAHEYSPAQGRDAIASLTQAMQIFDV